MVKKILIVLGTLVFLTVQGCAMFNENNDNEKFYEMHEEDSRFDNQSIQTQSWTINDTFKAAIRKIKDPTAIALLAVIAGDRIAGLKASPLNVKRAPGGYDVLNTHAGTAITAVLSGVLGYFAFDAIKTAAWSGGGEYYFQNEGDLQIKDAMNYVEQHQTYSSSATQSLLPSTVRPEVVYPQNSLIE